MKVNNMKLCIIGPEKRTGTELEILKKAKDIFDSVLYIPYTSISVSSNRVTYKNINLSKFDAVLPIIPREKNLFACSLLNNIKSFSPISPSAYLLAYNRFLLLDNLRKRGFSTPKIYLINSPKTIRTILDSNEINFPISLRISSNEQGIMLANNKTEVRSMLDTLETFEKMVYIEEFFDSNYIQIYVIGDSVFGVKRIPIKKTDIYFGKGKIVKYKMRGEIKKLSLQLAMSVNSKVLTIDMTEKTNKIINVRLVPLFQDAEKVLNKDMNTLLLNFIKDSVKKSCSIFEEFIDDIKLVIKDVFK